MISQKRCEIIQDDNLKRHKTARLTLSLENTFLEKPQG